MLRRALPNEQYLRGDVYTCAAAQGATRECVKLHGAIAFAGCAGEGDSGLFLRCTTALAGVSGGEIGNRRRYANSLPAESVQP